ncbi:MAG: type II secretion system protein [Christensenellaceae bacterium]
MDYKKTLRSKKAMTLVEVIVSVAILAFIAVAMLGLLLPAINLQKDATMRDTDIYESAEHLAVSVELANPTSGGNTVVDPYYYIKFDIGGKQVVCKGSLVTTKSNDVDMKAFVPKVAK